MPEVQQPTSVTEGTEGELPEDGAQPPASPPAPEGGEPPAPDQFEGLTVEEARKRFPEAFKADWEKGRQHGHGEGGREFAAERKKWDAETAATRTFERLEGLRTSDDPAQRDQFSREIADAQNTEAYNRGKALKAGPSREQIEREVGGAIVGSVSDMLSQRPELQGLSEEERKSINPANFKTIRDLAAAQLDLAIQRGIVAGKVKADDKTVRENVTAAERRVKDELGIAPEPLEGGAAPGSWEEGQQRYIDGDMSSEEYAALCERHGREP